MRRPSAWRSAAKQRSSPCCRSGITYQLKLNGGDMKSVQGGSCHTQLKMKEAVCSHIVDEARCVNAQRFEAEFQDCG